LDAHLGSHPRRLRDLLTQRDASPVDQTTRIHLLKRPKHDVGRVTANPMFQILESRRQKGEISVMQTSLVGKTFFASSCPPLPFEAESEFRQARSRAKQQT
jgi:hypothetical protein